MFQKVCLQSVDFEVEKGLKEGYEERQYPAGKHNGKGVSI